MANTFDHSVVGRRFGPLPFSYDQARVSLFSLASGATEQDLDLILESRGPKPLPSFAVVMTTEPMAQAMIALGGNLLMRLHAAQRVRLHRPIPASGTLEVSAQVDKIWDQGKGALVILSGTATDPSSGALVAETEMEIFYRAHGGFGGQKAEDPPPFAAPEGRAPDLVIPSATASTQAHLYRLASGDLNGIHADPAVAKKVALPKPILHGMCTFGFGATAICRALVGGDPAKIREIYGRFTKPVFPGEKLETEVWRVGEQQAIYRVRSTTRGDVAIDLGQVVLA
ncbi:MAG: MaoC/PaaZ C-terminal domain-containing protein [Myxococcota bacterium]